MFVAVVSFFVARVEFQVDVLAPEESVSNLPGEDLQPVVELGVLVFAVLSICMRNRLRFTDSKHCFGDAVALDIVSQTQ